MPQENLYTPRCIRTVTGLYVNVFEPTPEMFSIRDIAWALSNVPRFGGHLPKWYSVAMHCMNVCDLVHRSHQLAALLHDASEAYLTDMPSPIKNELPEYRAIEDRLMGVIADRFGFPLPLYRSIKAADKDMLEMEWERLMLSNGTLPYMELSVAECAEAFEKRYWKLTHAELMRAKENATPTQHP